MTDQEVESQLTLVLADTAVADTVGQSGDTLQRVIEQSWTELKTGAGTLDPEANRLGGALSDLLALYRGYSIDLNTDIYDPANSGGAMWLILSYAKHHLVKSSFTNLLDSLR